MDGLLCRGYIHVMKQKGLVLIGKGVYVVAVLEPLPLSCLVLTYIYFIFVLVQKAPQ
jgi:hypothetical protein